MCGCLIYQFSRVVKKRREPAVTYVKINGYMRFVTGTDTIYLAKKPFTTAYHFGTKRICRIPLLNWFKILEWKWYYILEWSHDGKGAHRWCAWINARNNYVERHVCVLSHEAIIILFSTSSVERVLIFPSSEWWGSRITWRRGRNINYRRWLYLYPFEFRWWKHSCCCIFTRRTTWL